MALFLGDKQIAGSANVINDSGTPIGTIIEYSSTIIPDGWLLADGSEVSRITYKDLFSIIGTTYGEGDGSSTFNLPNRCGKVGVGLNVNDTDFNALGKTGGEKEHQLSIAEMPNHDHPASANYNEDWWYVRYDTTDIPHYGNYSDDGDNQKDMWISKTTHSQGGDQAHNNMQPYIVSNYIIKATKIPVEISESEIYQTMVNQINNLHYPIGRGFIDFTDTDYSNYLGFTWERELVGMFPVGLDTNDTNFNTIGKTGGSASHKHGLTNAVAMINNKQGRLYTRLKSSITTWYSTIFTSNAIFSTDNTSNSGGAELDGDTDVSTNLPPYKVVSYWKRVS